MICVIILNYFYTDNLEFQIEIIGMIVDYFYLNVLASYFTMKNQEFLAYKIEV